MVVSALVKSNRVGSGSSCSSGILGSIETQSTDAGIGVEIAKCFSRRIQSRVCHLISEARIALIGVLP